MAVKNDWVMCKNCPHTVNTHTRKGEVGECRGYLCECKEFVEKKQA